MRIKRPRVGLERNQPIVNKALNGRAGGFHLGRQGEVHQTVLPGLAPHPCGPMPPMQGLVGRGGIKGRTG